MGLFSGVSKCSCYQPTIIEKIVEKVKTVGNPKPNNFKIITIKEHKPYCIVELQYPDCVNYNGHKLCVYNASEQEIRKQDFLDPHFCENEHLSPIARFEPTIFGWKLAEKTVKALNEESSWNLGLGGRYS